MVTSWVVLLVTAATDFLIVGGTSLMTAMMATGTAELPARSVLIVSAIGGVVAMARTIQSALRSTPEFAAMLKGVPVRTHTEIETTVEPKTPRREP
jgi:hypothetical protein